MPAGGCENCTKFICKTYTSENFENLFLQVKFFKKFRKKVSLFHDFKVYFKPKILCSSQRQCSRKYCQHSKGTNVPQTFHKRSDIHIIGMKPKRSSSFPNLSYRKRSFLFNPGEQTLDQIETICFQYGKFGNDTKTFWFRSKTI
jgi:hypothetical protein